MLQLRLLRLTAHAETSQPTAEFPSRAAHALLFTRIRATLLTALIHRPMGACATTQLADAALPQTTSLLPLREFANQMKSAQFANNAKCSLMLKLEEDPFHVMDVIPTLLTAQLLSLEPKNT